MADKPRLTELFARSASVGDAMVDVLVGDETVNVFCPTGPGGGVDPTCGKSENGKEIELWNRVSEQVPKHVLERANVKSFEIGKTDDPSTGGRTFEGRVVLDGSDFQTALHEVSHNIENGYDAELRSLRIKLRDDPRVSKLSPRERVTVVVESFFSMRGSRANRWLVEKLPDVADELKKVFSA